MMVLNYRSAILKPRSPKGPKHENLSFIPILKWLHDILFKISGTSYTKIHPDTGLLFIKSNAMLAVPLTKHA